MAKGETMRYKVELIKSEEGYAVGCPELPGCWSQGNTEEEALANIKSAITEYLEVVEEMNRRKETRYVEVLAS
jgi:predicted RNase H-like HicB family nuclease